MSSNSGTLKNCPFLSPPCAFVYRSYDSSLWREIRLYNRSLDYFQLQSIVSRQPQTLMLTNCTVKSRVIHSVLDL